MYIFILLRSNLVWVLLLGNIGLRDPISSTTQPEAHLNNFSLEFEDIVRTA